MNLAGKEQGVLALKGQNHGLGRGEVGRPHRSAVKGKRGMGPVAQVFLRRFRVEGYGKGGELSQEAAQPGFRAVVGAAVMGINDILHEGAPLRDLECQ